MRIEDYLSNHTIVRIGITLPGYVCCETIVDNPIELISVIKNNDCYITEIRWWDRAEIASGSSIGYGGPRDPKSPDSHFFAETDIYKVFTPLSQDEEYYGYLDQIESTHSNLNLFPAFDIKKIKKQTGNNIGTVPTL